MKIAVSGSSGVGKSTLAQALAGALHIAYIPEHYEMLAGNMKGSPFILAGLFNRVLDLKLSEQERLGSFVVDRSPADLLNLAMHSKMIGLEEELMALCGRCREAMADYDIIIIPPLGVVPLQARTDGKRALQRHLRPWVQLSNHAAIIGLVKMFAGEDKVIYLPETPLNEEQWLDIALKRAALVSKQNR